MAELLRELYGDRVRLGYYDLGDFSAGAVEDLRLLMPEDGRPDRWQFPLLLVNGKARISGYFDLRLMQDVIQAEMEMAE